MASGDTRLDCVALGMRGGLWTESMCQGVITQAHAGCRERSMDGDTRIRRQGLPESPPRYSFVTTRSSGY